jgi:flavin reductase (DIM6/NTAB) family NADH-FMN oxidoreductase RutF
MLDKQAELFEGLVAYLLSPRLTAVITTVDPKGRVNAAPFSFFMPISYVPPRVCFSCFNHKHHEIVPFHYESTKPVKEILELRQYAGETEETPKDTLVNVLDQGEFGINILPIEYLQQMVQTTPRYPHGVDEIEVAGLTSYPSTKIKPPLIKEAKVALECVKVYYHGFGLGMESYTLIVGECLVLHVDSDIMEGEEFKPERMQSILQVAGPTYGVCTNFQYKPRHPYPEPDVIPMPKTT